MQIRFEPIRLTLDDEARLVFLDDRLLAVITLQQDEQMAGGSVHVEAYFKGDAPDVFDTLEGMEQWIAANADLIG